MAYVLSVVKKYFKGLFYLGLQPYIIFILYDLLVMRVNICIAVIVSKFRSRDKKNLYKYYNKSKLKRHIFQTLPSILLKNVLVIRFLCKLTIQISFSQLVFQVDGFLYSATAKLSVVLLQRLHYIAREKKFQTYLYLLLVI